MNDDPSRALYPSAAPAAADAAVPQAAPGNAATATKPAASDALYSTATKAAGAPPAAAPPAQSARPTWQAPGAAQPVPSQPETKGAAKPPAEPAARPGAKPAEPSASPAATLYDSPIGAAELADVLRLPDDPEAAGFATSPEANAERAVLRDALVAEGINRAEAETIWRHAMASAAPDYAAPDYAAAERELRAEWQGDYDANLRAARSAVQRIAAKVPGITRHLRETGADNDPALIRSLAKMGRKRGL